MTTGIKEMQLVEAERGEQLPTLAQGEHVHHCGVSGCTNQYTCRGKHCAGQLWPVCPACDMDERDRFHDTQEKF